MYGVHPVEEWLRRAPHRVREVRLLPETPRLAAVAGLARAAGVPVRDASRPELGRLSGGGRHQGCAARVAPFAYAALEEVLVRRERGPVVVADGVEDPRNLGAILRVAAAVGAAGVIVPRRRAAAVTPAAEKAAAGMAGAVPVCRVTNVARTLAELRSAGFWIAGLATRGGCPLYQASLPEPLVVVIGGEKGLRPLVEAGCDLRLTIPMAPGVESLNVAAALAVALYEVVRRRVRPEDPAIPSPGGG